MTDGKIRYQLSVREAAERLGVSEGAVRQRIRRGTLDIRRKDRRLVVLLSEADVVQDDLQDMAASSPDTTIPSDDTRTVHEPSRTDVSHTEHLVSRSELDSANQAYDELAQAWARDLRRQLDRLEQEVDRLHGELSEMRKRHAEEMRRKDILLQGNQEALAAWIGQLTGTTTALPSQRMEPDT